MKKCSKSVYEKKMPRSEEKVSKCHKKTYKEALTGNIPPHPEGGNHQESGCSSFIPTEEQKSAWISNVNSTNSDQGKYEETTMSGSERRLEIGDEDYWCDSPSLPL